MDTVAPETPRIDNFLYLNRDNAWLGFHRHGLEIRDDGALQLWSLPLLEGQLEKQIKDPSGPAGIALDSDGTIYISDPLNHQLVKIGCDGRVSIVSCIGGEGSLPVQFNTSRGLLIPKYRHSLFVADSENHRVQIFALPSGQLVDIWGQPAGVNDPQPSAEPGRFNTPWAIAGDDSGNIYVVDYGNQRVQKFNYAGDVLPQFWETAASAHFLVQPSDIAAYSYGEAVRLYIVDEAAHAVFVADGDGHPIRDAHNQPISFGAAQLQKPMGIAVAANAVYVGDNELHRILKFSSADYSYIGDAIGYEGPVAGLALDSQGNLLVHTGTDPAPVRLALQGYRTQGALWSDAISVSGAQVAWHQVQARTEKSRSNTAQLRLFFHTSDDQNDQPQVLPDSDQPFADPGWQPPALTPDAFADSHDLFIGGPPARYLWIGALFLGDGHDTSVVPQIRVDFDHDGYLDELPAIYQTEPASRDFLLRFLALTETLFQDLEVNIQGLPRLFDPQAVPKEFLSWLASWLGLELYENWSEQEQRRLIASAFERYGRRGTLAGLRESLRLFAGVNGIIQEPILNAAWWSLPSRDGACGCQRASSPSKNPSWQGTENSILGMTTRLAAAHPQGAVLGATATLDYSNLITNEQFGAPLFEDVAHQFNVQIYRSGLQCPEAISRVRAVLDREKPAHTAYHLCVIEPRMRVGFQAYVGIDTVVAGSAQEIRLGEGKVDGTTVVAGDPGGRVGEDSRIGLATRL